MFFLHLLIISIFRQKAFGKKSRGIWNTKKYRVLRNGAIVYCEMRAELIGTESGEQDIVVGFSNNDMRVRREMVYQSTVQEEISKVEKTRNSLAGIAELARKLEEAIDENLSTL